jgi:methylmalonyl-CoA/ethylmalonyl-CoA epimerase
MAPLLPELRVHHGCASVPDLEAAITWYGDMLGFEVEKRFHVGPVAAAMLRRGDLCYELFQPPAEAAPLPDDRRYPNRDLLTHGNKHIAFRIPSLDDFLVVAEAKGADIALVVRQSFGRGVFLRDCAGNLIEFVEDDEVPV